MLVRYTHGASMPRRSDRFLFGPFLAAALLWVCCVAPFASSTIGLFPPPWLLFAALAAPAAALWCLISIVRSLVARNWRRATSTITAGILFVGGTALVVINRADLLVSTAVWQIKAEVALLDSAHAATFKTNRGVSEGTAPPLRPSSMTPRTPTLLGPGSRRKYGPVTIGHLPARSEAARSGHNRWAVISTCSRSASTSSLHT